MNHRSIATQVLRNLGLSTLLALGPFAVARASDPPMTRLSIFSDQPASERYDFDKYLQDPRFEGADWSNGPQFAVTWRRDHIHIDSAAIMHLILDKVGCPVACAGRPYASGEFRSVTPSYGFGSYEVLLRAAKGPGIVTYFSIYSGEFHSPNHSEISMIVLGEPSTQIQVANYAYGEGEISDPIDLHFDATTSFHRYGFTWGPSQIDYYVDGKLVRTVGGISVPQTEGNLLLNTWTGSESDTWPGAYQGAGTQTQVKDLRWSRSTKGQ